MTSSLLHINLTVDIPSSTKTATLHSVNNSMHQDITAIFVKFCKDGNLSLNTQDEIEAAVIKFTEVNKHDSAVMP